MKKSKNCLKIIVFLLLLSVCVCKVSSVLDEPKGKEWAMETGMDEVRKHPNKYDICFVGASTMISNISNQYLYEEYGIAGVSIGEPRENLIFSKYTLEEVLRYQNPKIVFLDASSIIFYESDMKKLLADNYAGYRKKKGKCGN